MREMREMKLNDYLIRRHKRKSDGRQGHLYLIIAKRKSLQKVTNCMRCGSCR
jgi:succinate dehydrogenase/fumarate reductase-like Fe-S protein